MSNVPARRFLHPPRTGGRSISRSWGLGHPEYQKHAPPGPADFIYGVARNPWDRVISLWHWEEEGKSGFDRNFEGWLRDGMMTFSTGSGFKVARPCSWWLHPLQAGRWQDRPDIIALRGLRDADYIIRFERWDEDLGRLAEMLDRPMPHKHVGKSIRRPYQEYYNDVTRDLVAELYEEDIRLYGYTFDA